MKTIVCKGCGTSFTHEQKGPGRPPTKCAKCKGEAEKEKQQKNPEPKPFKEGVVTVSGPYQPDIKLVKESVEKFSEPRKDVVLLRGNFDPDPEVVQRLSSKNKSEEPLGSYTYEVTVTNLGFGYRGEDVTEAKKRFKHYKEASERGFGQVGHERVTLYQKGEIISQYDYSKDKQT